MLYQLTKFKYVKWVFLLLSSLLISELDIVVHVFTLNTQKAQASWIIAQARLKEKKKLKWVLMPRDPFSHGENPTVPIPYVLLFLTELFCPQDHCGSDNHLKMPYLLLLPWGEFVNHLRWPGRVENRQLIGKILHPIDFGLKSSHVAYSFGVTNLYLQLSPFTSSYCEWVLRLQVLKKWQVWGTFGSSWPNTKLEPCCFLRGLR